MGDNIHLSKDELDSLISSSKKIGEGTEGACYYHGNNELYKIYHKTIESSKLIIDAPYDDEGVRIYDPNNKIVKINHVYDNRLIKYVDHEGVKLSVEDGLKRAIDNGNKIKGTRLPTKIIYVDNKVKGCVIPYHRYTKGIYSAYANSYKTRLKICKKLLSKVQELVDNYIYPVDLCQKDEDRLFNKRSSNVLLRRFTNEPIIIDLEGKSTLYTDHPNYKYEGHTAQTLSTLILELMSKEDIQEDIKDENYEVVIDYLSKLGIEPYLIDRYLDYDININNVEEIVNQIEYRR